MYADVFYVIAFQEPLEKSRFVGLQGSGPMRCLGSSTDFPYLKFTEKVLELFKYLPVLTLKTSMYTFTLASYMIMFSIDTLLIGSICDDRHISAAEPSQGRRLSKGK